MNRQLQATLIGALLSSLAAFCAFAQERAPAAQDIKRPRATLNATEAQSAPAREIAADAPNARIAALIRRDLVMPRNKGIQTVRRIGVGIYCIKPTAASGVDRKFAIVMLTPEYYFSLLNEIKVQWAYNGSGCADDEFGVYTLSDPSRTGLYRFSNDVSFSIYVP